jgi:NmrA-like family
MILVTGATGTNGRFVVQALLAASVRVRAMVQDSSRAMDLQRAGAELVAADFDQPGTLDAALAGVDGCLLLSAVDKQLDERETRFVKRATKAPGSLVHFWPPAWRRRTDDHGQQPALHVYPAKRHQSTRRSRRRPQQVLVGEPRRTPRDQRIPAGLRGSQVLEIEKGLCRRAVAPSDRLPRERLSIDPP